MQQQPPVETVEEFKLRIAAIIRAKPEQIPAAKRLRRLKLATNPKANWRTTPLVMGYGARQFYGFTSPERVLTPGISLVATLFLINAS